MDIIERVISNREHRPAPPGQDSGVSTTSSRANENKTMPLVPKFNPVPRRKTTNKEIHELAYKLKDGNDEEVAAPMGFEPEGSATRPNFCEGCSSLQGLLSDRYGYQEFYEYLRLQNSESLLAFWRSCEKFRQLAKARSNLALPTANSTYAKYMHKNLLCGSRIDVTIRAKIKHKLNSGQPLNESMFDSAQETIFSYMNDYFYGSFIQSDIYKGKFVGDEAVKNTTQDRVSTAARNPRFTAKALPTLPEEKVFEGDTGNDQWTSICDPVVLRSMCRQADGMKEGYVLQNLTKRAMAGIFHQPIPPVVSVNDSDVQSLSSDALTDDSKSTVTDFSDMTSKSIEKKKREQGFHGIPGFIPRTKRLPKDCKQLPPEQFARILIEKLERVLVEREQEERAATNLGSLPREHFRESKKSILQDARDRHRQFQQARQFGLQVPAQKLPESYPIHGNCSIISSSSHVGFVESCPMSNGYYQNTEPIDSANRSWNGCVPNKNMLHSPQCAALTNTKKQWESVGTIESAPDSGICIEEEHSLQPDLKSWIVQWMEQGEKEATQLPPQSSDYTKHTRTKHASGHPVPTDPGLVNIQPVAQDPLMPPLPQPDSRNTLEETARRLAQKNSREKRSKSHHKNRPGYVSSKSSQVTCPQFSGSSVVSGDYHQKCMYSSSSVLSSAPSTNSKDSGLGSVQKRNKKQAETTTVVYYLGSESEPYQSILPGKIILLGQFKHLIMNFKKGNHRYFFKRKSEEESCGAIFEEITDDNEPLPLFNSKITCKVKFV